jgi:RNA polymerase sigma-70 factor (ECF subfamily)
MSRPVEAVDALLSLARAGQAEARGQVLELYRNYLELLARIQIGRRLQSKVDAADLVQETFLDAHASFDDFRGTSERELAAWLRQVLAFNLASLVRRYHGTRRRDVALERELARELDESSHALDRGFVAADSSPS